MSLFNQAETSSGVGPRTRKLQHQHTKPNSVDLNSSLGLFRGGSWLPQKVGRNRGNSAYRTRAHFTTKTDFQINFSMAPTPRLWATFLHFTLFCLTESASLCSAVALCSGRLRRSQWLEHAILSKIDIVRLDPKPPPLAAAASH